MAWFADCLQVRLIKMEDITTCYERGGQPEWDNNDYQRDFTWLGIRRDLMINKYTITPELQKRLDNDYTYHPPIEDQQERYVHLRECGKYLAQQILRNTPPSREQSVALTLLDQVLMMANAAIARNE